MKKVWILEKFATHEEMVKSCGFYKECIEQMIAEGKDENEIACFEEFATNYEKLVKENPDGRWYGFEGKIKYNDFCYTAKAAIRRNPDGKFRVIEAEIEDNATTWTGYKFVKENEGVLRYLMATK